MKTETMSIPLNTHLPVLLAEVLLALNLQKNGKYVDCTFGRGGHTQAILQHLEAEGRLLAFDQDPEAVAAGKMIHDQRFTIIHCSFAQLTQQIIAQGWLGKVNGILLDLGVSSPQLETAARGFSFRQEGPLDMRMNPLQGERLAQWLAKVATEELAEVLKIYGEERYARRIAKAIIIARQQHPLTTTTQLANIIAAAHPAWPEGKHPATCSFQALRIFINQELEQLQQVLPQTLDVLSTGGRLVVISFHSLEDRLVKRFIRQEVRGDDFPKNIPIPAHELHPRLRAIGKPIFPSAQEIMRNPRARSAVLRVAEKC
jgi:16S rRNA (cytosine1402-N4)-methyltransferase